MILLLMLTALAGEPPPTMAKETIIVENKPPEVYVDSAIIVDETRVLSETHTNSIISGMAAQYAHHYFPTEMEPVIFDDMSNSYAQDCDYQSSTYECSLNNDHWYVMTNIHLTKETLGISMKVYDNYGKLRAATATTNIVKTECRTPPRRRVPHPTQGSVPYEPPEECKEVYPRLLSKSLRQSIKILFSNIRP